MHTTIKTILAAKQKKLIAQHYKKSISEHKKQEGLEEF
jgi:hypothetical protein